MRQVRVLHEPSQPFTHAIWKLLLAPRCALDRAREARAQDFRPVTIREGPRGAFSRPAEGNEPFPTRAVGLPIHSINASNPEHVSRERMKTMDTKDCPHCKQPFAPRRTNQRFCSDPCRVTFHLDERKRGLALLRGTGVGASPDLAQPMHSTDS
jgi:hypothetical protein